MRENKTVKNEILFDVIIEAIKNKKGKEIVSINLKKIQNSVCEYFIICSGDSTTQVRAIVEEIRQKTKEIAGNPPDHIEGLKNSHWVLIDFINIVVHVFIPGQRTFYQLEELWADGELMNHDDD